MKAKGLDVAITFDTTGSMYPVLAQVRSKVEGVVKDLFSSIEDIRIAVIAHGDYCDKGNPYTIRIMYFTKDKDEICRFIRETEKTYGGDADECYELTLNQARTTLNWGADREKLLVVIGDASPHGVDYPENKDHIDWVNEVKLIGEMGIQIYAVHALSYYRTSSKKFYKSIAEYTKGVYLTLDQFEEINDLIKATCMSRYSEEKLNEYVSVIRERGSISHSMLRNINRLQGLPEDTGYNPVQKEGLIAVAPGRFQVMTVAENCDIKGFVESHGIEFKKGRGFYELTKHETIQQYKEIIIQDRETGELFTGAQVRELLKLQPQIEKGGAKESLSSKNTKEYRIFVQSTSYNRKLMAGTTFMYEVEDIEVEGTTITEPKKDSEIKRKASRVTSKISENKGKALKKASETSKKSKETKPTTKSKELYTESELLDIFVCEEERKEAEIVKKSEPCKLGLDSKELIRKLNSLVDIQVKSSKIIQSYIDGIDITDEDLLELIFELENTADNLKKYL